MPASEKLFITDYENDEKIEIVQRVQDQFQGVHLPNQTDEWGCVTATGAFIVNQLRGENSVTSVALDAEIDRAVGEPGDSSLLALGFLNRNLSVDTYAPSSPLDEPAKMLVHGKMDLDAYLQILQQHFGAMTEENYRLAQDYYLNTFIPSYLANEERFADYKKSGQATTHKDAQITEKLVEGLVNEGNYLFATEMVDAGISHAVAIFRPDLTMPALVFSPYEDGSEVWPLSRYTFENVTSTAIGAVALWDNRLK